MTLIRRSLLILLLVCLGCVAQSAPPDVARKIEHQVRAFYTIPAEVKVTVGAITPSTDWPGYDAVAVNIDGGDGKQKDYKFLLSKDRSTMLRVTKFDLTKDPFAEVMSKIDVTGRPSRGAKSAKVVAVNFDDFECPFCSQHAPHAVSRDSQGIRRPGHLHLQRRSALRDSSLGASMPPSTPTAWRRKTAMPIGISPTTFTPTSTKSTPKRLPARASKPSTRSRCCKGQKHNVDAPKLQSCVKAQNEDAVRASMKEADGLGVNGTPALFINGQKIDGAVPLSEVRAALDAALKDAGEPVPSTFRQLRRQHPSNRGERERRACFLGLIFGCVAVRNGETSLEKKLILCPVRRGAVCRRSAGSPGRLQLADRRRRDGHCGWPQDFPHRRRQVLRQQCRLRPAGAHRRAGHRAAPEYSAPDDRRRDPDAPRRKTRPAGHRRRSRSQVQRIQVALYPGRIRQAPERQEDHAGRFQARHPALHHASKR